MVLQKLLLAFDSGVCFGVRLLVYVGGSDGSGPDSAGTASGPEANLKGHVTGQSQILSGPQAVSDTGTGRDSDSGPGPAAGSGSPT